MEVEMDFARRISTFSEVVSRAACTNSANMPIALEASLILVMGHLCKLKQRDSKLYIIGNGGSAAVASHALVDFVNVAKIDAQVLHESSLITCMANDYGYDVAYARVLSAFMKAEDILIAISSSGKSLNICNAAKAAKEKNAIVITLTGFSEDNPLRQLGDINFWLDSNDYGYVEVGHQFILHNLSDRFGVESKNLQLKTEEKVTPVYA